MSTTTTQEATLPPVNGQWIHTIVTLIFVGVLPVLCVDRKDVYFAVAVSYPALRHGFAWTVTKIMLLCKGKGNGKGKGGCCK